jgi:hypothetical protein
MYVIPDVNCFRDFSIPLNDDIINCFVQENSSDKIIKDEKLEELITKEDKIILDKFISAENTTNYINKEVSKQKTKTYVTGLKIKYSVKSKIKNSVK